MSTAVQDIEAIQTALRVRFPEVVVDGDIGKRTMSAIGRLGDDEIKRRIQGLLGYRFPQVRPDGVFGPITLSAIRALDELGDHESMADELDAGRVPMPTGADFHTVLASSFADPADVRAFRACKLRGGTDGECFKVGDNGIGKWGANCAQEDVPMVALPREVWRAAGKTGGDLVSVAFPAADVIFTAQLGDTMPALANIKNGAGMDCNPAAVRLLKHVPPMMLKGVGWRWA